MLTKRTREKSAALLIAAGLTVLLLWFPGAAKEGVERGLSLTVRWLVPSLFPYMVLSSFLLRTGGGRLLDRLLRPITERVFRLPSSAGPVILFSLIGGYPVGAKCVRLLYDRGELSPQEAERLMCFCICSGPSFLVTALGTAMLHNPRAGMLLYGVQVLCALMIGWALGFGHHPDQSPKPAPPPSSPLLKGALEAVSDAASSLLGVAGTVMLFQWLESMLTACGGKEAVSETLRLLGLPFPGHQAVVSMLLEVTGACVLLTEYSLPLWWFAAAAGFGGLCVWVQVIGLLGDLPVSKGRILLFRFVQAGLSAVAAALLGPVFLPAVETMAIPGGASFEVSAATGAGSIALLLLSGVFVLCFRREQKA